VDASSFQVCLSSSNWEMEGQKAIQKISTLLLEKLSDEEGMKKVLGKMAN
jgi:hypothetical protein